MHFQDLIINIFTSGRSHSYKKHMEEKVQKHDFSDYLIKYILLNFILILGFVVSVIFVFQNISTDSYFDAIAGLFMAFVLIIVFFVSRTNVPQIVLTFISSISFGFYLTLLIWDGDAQGAGFLFIFIYPMITVLLLGLAKGITLSVILLIIVIVEFFIPGASRFEYHLDVSLRMIAVYIMISGTTLVFEISRKNKDKVNENLTQKIMGINENLQNIVEQRTKKIVKLQNAILKTMSNLVEYRDFVTGKHVERTQYSVSLLLDEIKNQKIFSEIINSWDINLVLQSVQLHDIGKIAISDLILNKPAQLTKDEYNEMKKHTVFGFKIIERIEADSGESELLNHAKIFALTHHEKWDGTGYPNGLHGDNIPLQGRIMAIADVYDALISERPYKKALPHEEAVKIIISGKGTQFDPVLIDLFIKLNNRTH